MKRFLGSCATIGLILSCIGCNNNPATGPDKTVTVNPDAGRFGISHLKGLAMARENASVKEGEDIRFDLGSIKGSTGFFFLLYNVGATPITNVTLGTDNNSFSVYPMSMDTLVPGSDLGMLPIVKVNAFHGTPLDGVGNRPLLPKGDNTFTLAIKGTTKTSAGADTTVELQVEMDLTALVMDLSVSMMDGVVDIVDMNNTHDNSLFSDHPLLANKNITNIYSRCSGDTIIHLLNTGNVPLHVKVYHAIMLKSDRVVTLETRIDTLLGAAATLSFAFDTISEYYNSFVIAASGENTIADPARLYQNEDGACYLQVISNRTSCTEQEANAAMNSFVESRQTIACAKMYTLIDNNKIFYAQSCTIGDTLYGLYDLTGAPLCVANVSGGVITKQCSGGENEELVDVILGNIRGPAYDFRTLGLASGRVNGGGSEGWSMK